ncbi:YqiJ family protein [Sphingopyxis sp.]|jgi:hypothetical protein|uniref:YqiJ family protein n=1 Tax=Sphingopyxis sp. TaxID=1908224 RepID=UPI003F70B889
MLDPFLATENVVFSAALLLMLLIGAVQAVGLAGDLDSDLHAEADGDVGFADTLLAWAGIGRLPFLMWLVIFLALFGALGLGLQQLMAALTGGPGTNLLMVPLTAIAAVPVTGAATRLVARILPGLETTAIERDELIGLYAEISIGTASVGNPARASVVDRHGQAHQIMVEPDSHDQRFQTGEKVLLVKIEGNIFKAFTRGDFYLPRLD